MLSLITGDFIHNLRSSLDHIVYALALQVTSSPSRDVAFPVCFTATGRGSFQMSGLRKIAVLDPRAQQVIEDFQPYKRTDPADEDALWILHDLWNIDKHRSIHLIGPALRQIGMWAPPGATDTSIRSGPFNDGDIVARARLAIPVDPKAHPQVDMTFTIALDEAGPARGSPLLDTLDTLYQYVRDEVFPAFVPLFP